MTKRDGRLAYYGLTNAHLHSLHELTLVHYMSHDCAGIKTEQLSQVHYMSLVFT